MLANIGWGEFSISKEIQKLAEILLIAKKNNNQLAVCRRYVVRGYRECRRIAAALCGRIRACGQRICEENGP
jgi:hypothetical protein